MIDAKNTGSNKNEKNIEGLGGPIALLAMGLLLLTVSVHIIFVNSTTLSLIFGTAELLYIGIIWTLKKTKRIESGLQHQNTDSDKMADSMFQLGHQTLVEESLPLAKPLSVTEINDIVTKQMRTTGKYSTQRIRNRGGNESELYFLREIQVDVQKRNLIVADLYNQRSSLVSIQNMLKRDGNINRLICENVAPGVDLIHNLFELDHYNVDAYMTALRSLEDSYDHILFLDNGQAGQTWQHLAFRLNFEEIVTTNVIEGNSQNLHSP